MTNMRAAQFRGKIFPINPKYPTVLGLPAFGSVLDVADHIDLGVIVTPAATVPALMRDCGRKGISTIIIISAGFKEAGEAGQRLEEEVLKISKELNIRVLGPNCLGCMNPHIGLNATFAATTALKGNIAFLSQSGALCTAMLDWSLERDFGFSAFVSLGSMSDIDWGDLIDYLAEDAKTEAILIYMESIGDAGKFISLASSAVARKPLFVMKTGKTQAAAKAAISHTGTLAGSDDVFSSAMRQIGITRLNTIEELCDLAWILAKQPLPKGNRLTIVTNAGGPAVIAVDAALQSGALLTELPHKALDALNEVLPAAWSHGNPIDILGDADAARYTKAVQVSGELPDSDGLLVILTPQDMTDPVGTAEAVVGCREQFNKPLFASWMGRKHVEEGKKILKRAGVPSIEYPDSAAHYFGVLASHQNRLRTLSNRKKSPDLTDWSGSVRAEVENHIREAREANRKILTESSSKALIHAIGIPVTRDYLAKTPQEAAEAAEKIGFPVVLKLHSTELTHKTDVGGVKLNILESTGVLKAYQEIESAVTFHASKEAFGGVTVQKMITWKGVELIFGASKDPQWGPVILFGAGGEFVEIYHDHTLGLPPLSHEVALEMIEGTKIVKVLQGARGREPVNIDALAKLLVQFALFASSFPEIAECDINPLLACGEQFIALDARIILD
jgi:acetyltransferase